MAEGIKELPQLNPPAGASGEGCHTSLHAEAGQCAEGEMLCSRRRHRKNTNGAIMFSKFQFPFSFEELLPATAASRQQALVLCLSIPAMAAVIN